MTRGTSSRRTLFRAVPAALVAVLFGALAAPIPGAVAAVPTPTRPSGLPVAAEALAHYVAQSSCEPADKPGTVALGKLLVATYPGTRYGVSRACTAKMASEHYDGRALDWMVSVRKPAQAAQASALLTWLFGLDASRNQYANARRLGVMYIIWNNKIWGSYATSSGWKPYSTCAAHPEPSWDTTCHRDHVHISLSWAGAMQRTSFWTKRVAAQDYGPCRPRDLNWAAPYTVPNPTPCPRYPTVTPPAGASPALVALTRFSGAYLRPGSTGPAVTALQQALRVEAVGVFGPKTTAAVVRFKQARRLPANPLIDAPTWRALLASLTPPKAAATKTAQPAVTPVKASPAPHPLAKYRNTVLRYNARGPAVTALQKALRVQPVSGWFGPKTDGAVRTFQRSRRLRVTGVVDAVTWRALGA